jgi:hypothetical protein
MNEDLIISIDSAVEWFSENCTEKSRVIYFERGKLGDSGDGAVYVYLESENAM